MVSSPNFQLAEDRPVRFSGDRAANDPRQLQMFARKAVIDFSIPAKTADALGQVQADDGHVYYVKDDARGRLIRASEWLGTHIAEISGVAAPTPAIIELTSGELVFGSRRICGVSEATETTRYLSSKTTNELGMSTSNLGPLLSSIFVLDMALHNVDRNITNYLSVRDYDVRHLYAADFGRSLFFAPWSWNEFPSDRDNTVSAGRVLRRLHGFDRAAANRTLDRLAAIPVSALENILQSQPEDWLPQRMTDDFVGEWGRGMWASRIFALSKGIHDGSFL